MENKELETKVLFSGKGKEYFGIWIVNILLISDHARYLFGLGESSK